MEDMNFNYQPNEPDSNNEPDSTKDYGQLKEYIYTVIRALNRVIENVDKRTSHGENLVRACESISNDLETIYEELNKLNESPDMGTVDRGRTAVKLDYRKTFDFEHLFSEHVNESEISGDERLISPGNYSTIHRGDPHARNTKPDTLCNVIKREIIQQ